MSAGVTNRLHHNAVNSKDARLCLLPFLNVLVACERFAGTHLSIETSVAVRKAQTVVSWIFIIGRIGIVHTEIGSAHVVESIERPFSHIISRIELGMRLCAK